MYYCGAVCDLLHAGNSPSYGGGGEDEIYKEEHLPLWAERYSTPALKLNKVRHVGRVGPLMTPLYTPVLYVSRLQTHVAQFHYCKQ